MRDFALWLGLCLSVQALACSSPESPPPSTPDDSSIVVVNVSNMPARAVKLEIKGTLDGKPAMNSAELVPAASAFYLRFSGLAGRLVLDASASDSDGCLHGSGQGQVELPNELVEVPLPLAAQAPRQCGQIPPCAAGSICREQPTLTVHTPYSTFAISPTDIWAVGTMGTTLHYDGTRWSYVPVPTSYAGQYLNDVWASGPNDVWAVGQQGLILRYNGALWTMSPNSAGNDLNGIWGFSPANIWACGDVSECWHYNGTAAHGVACATRRPASF
jgi:hypothetical protein